MESLNKETTRSQGQTMDDLEIRAGTEGANRKQDEEQRRGQYSEEGAEIS